MASDVKTILARCPNTKVVAGGYSQGGQVVHNAFKNGISATQVKAAVIFGDPYNNQAVGDLATSSVKRYCAKGDLICETPGSFIVLPPHTTYGQNTDDAASFIVSTLGL
jgi:cutinase